MRRSTLKPNMWWIASIGSGGLDRLTFTHRQVTLGLTILQDVGLGVLLEY